MDRNLFIGEDTYYFAVQRADSGEHSQLILRERERENLKGCLCRCLTLILFPFAVVSLLMNHLDHFHFKEAK